MTKNKKIACFLYCLIFLSIFLMSSCYYIQEGTDLLILYNKGVLIEDLLKENNYTAQEKQLFDRIHKITDWARWMDLDLNEAYQKYIRLERDYVSLVLSAAPEFSLEAYYWKYPLVGALPYRAYFDKTRLKKEKNRLIARGYETYIAPVRAFSSLNYLSDPVFSYMKKYSFYALAETLLHEISHNNFFFSSSKNAMWNENIAEFIGEKAAETFIMKIYGPESVEYQSIFYERQYQIQINQEMYALYQKLSQLYETTDLSVEKKREEKKQIIQYYQDKWPALTGILNNAFIMNYRLYHQEKKYLSHFFSQVAQDNFSLFFFYLRALDEKKDLKEQLLNWENNEVERKDMYQEYQKMKEPSYGENIVYR